MRRSMLLPLAVALAACGSNNSPAVATPSPTATATATDSATPSATATATPAKAPRLRTIATGLHVPWGIAFLPNGDALVSERTTGKILRIPKGGGKPRTAMKVPGVNLNAGEGGLLGLAVSPDYAKDKLVYAYFTTDSDNRIARFKL